MLRKNGAALHHDYRSFWEYVEKVECDLAGVKGHGVRICGKVPQDVQEAALAAVPIDGPLEKKLKTRAGPSNNEGQISECTERARLKSGWILLLTNLILEIGFAVFDQLGHALVGMVLAFVALLLSTAELIHMARKERMCPSTVEYFGLVGAVWQCCYSTVEYAYARQNKVNPIKMCLLPFIFLLCVVISKLIKNELH